MSESGPRRTARANGGPGRYVPGRYVPGDAILHPVAIAAIALLLLNDHVLKECWPGLATGKLSDIAGLVFFPLFLLGIWEVAMFLSRRWNGPSQRSAIAAIVATGLGFGVVKTTALGATAFGWALSIGQWVPRLVIESVSGGATPPAAPAVVVADMGDLIALPALLVALTLALKRAHVTDINPSSS